MANAQKDSKTQTDTDRNRLRQANTDRDRQTGRPTQAKKIEVRSQTDKS